MCFLWPCTGGERLYGKIENSQLPTLSMVILANKLECRLQRRLEQVFWWHQGPSIPAEKWQLQAGSVTEQVLLCHGCVCHRSPTLDLCSAGTVRLGKLLFTSSQTVSLVFLCGWPSMSHIERMQTLTNAECLPAACSRWDYAWSNCIREGYETE